MYLSRAIVVLVLLPVGGVTYLVWMAYAGPKELTRVEKVEVYLEDERAKLPVLVRTGPMPRAVCEERVFDFGVMQPGESREREFVIQNTGETPLTVQKGWKSCDCTVAVLDKNSIAPGESLPIKVTWTTKEVDEKFHQTLHFHTNDAENDRISLIVKGRVMPSLMVVPHFTWSMGRIPLDSPGRVRGAVMMPGRSELEIKRVVIHDPSFHAEWQPFTADERREAEVAVGYWITLTADASPKEGTFSMPFFVETNLDDAKVLSCTVTGERTGAVRVVPMAGTNWNPRARTIDLGAFEKANGASAALSLFVSKLKDRDLEIVGAKSTIPELRIVFEKIDGPSEATARQYRLEVAVPAESPFLASTRAEPEFLVLETNHPDLPEWRIQIFGVAQ